MSRKEYLFWAVVIFTPLCLLLGQFASRIQVAQAKPPSAGSAELKVNASDFKFDPNSASVKAASPTKVTLTNKGAVDHTWVLLSKDGKELTKIEAKVGQTASKDFTAPAAGSYTFICDVPGHKESGMTGTLTVQ